MVAASAKLAGLVVLLAVLLPCFVDLPSGPLAALFQSGDPSAREAALLGSLQKALVTRPRPLFIGLGYNTNLDLVVNALDVLHSLGLEPPHTNKSHAVIYSTSDLLETFSHYFKQGSAAERYVADVPLFDQLVAAAAALPSAVYSPGGNAALMANRLAELGSDVFLGGPIGPRLADLLHPGIQHTGGEGTKDEVHLILEYARGAQWDHLTSPRANRFIAVHDETNSRLLALEDFHSSMEHFAPDLVILAGLHLLEGQPDEVRRERVQAVKQAVENTSQATDVHFELASIADDDLLSLVATELIGDVDSLGLNEQELGSLVQALRRNPACNAECQARIGELELSAFTNPSVRTVSNALRLVFQVLDHKDTQRRLLTRIHFHYLSYHVVAERRTASTASSKWRRWGTGGMSVVGGSLGGTARACGDLKWDVAPADVELRLAPETLRVQVMPKSHMPRPHNQVVSLIDRVIPIDPTQALTTWEDGDISFHLAPVLVCKQPTRTVGLGDVISSTGLVYALHNAEPRS